MPASNAKRAATADRRKQAIALRLAGMDWQTIADRLKYSSRGAACQDVTRALEAYRAEEAEQIDTYRQLEGQRLDRLQAAAWSMALKGDLKAIDTVLRVMAQRSKLLGLDMPVRTEISGPGGGAIPFSGGELAEIEALIAISEQDAGTPSPETRGGDDGTG